MRFLATGDLQCGNWKQFNVLRSDGIGSRLHQCLHIFQFLRKEAKRRGISKILLNGDIFEKNGVLEVEVFDAVYREVEKMHRAGLDVVMNIGNHDVTRASSEFLPSLHSLRIFNRVAQVVETPRMVWSCLCIVPWMAEPHALISQVDDMALHWELPKAAALALHAGISGAKAGTGQVLPSKIRLQDLHPERFKFILLSDYHHPQWIGKNALYMGSPLQHSFGETHRACVWEIEIGRHNLTTRPIYTPSPWFRWISVRKMSDAKKWFRRYRGDYLRVQTTPRIRTSELQKIAEHYGCLIQIENAPVYEKVVPEFTGAISDTSEILQNYVESSVKNPAYARRLQSVGERILNSV